MDETTNDSATRDIGASLELLVDRGVLAVAIARGGRLAWASPKFDGLFCMASGTAAGRALVDLSAEGDRERITLALETATIPPAGSVELSFDALRADGSVFEADLTAVAGEVDGTPATVLVVTDVTQRRRSETQLSYMAFIDPLTNLPNRSLFLDRLRETICAARARGHVFAVMFCDLDGFKAVNDTLGHDAGDVLLEIVSRRLEGAVRAGDTVARLGGDEFGVILPHVTRREDAAIVAERMRRALDEPVLVKSAPSKIGISIGIATFPADGEDLDTLTVRADRAMYASKSAGKNRYTFAERETGDVGASHADFFHWTAAHEVGVRSVDHQHEHLVTLLNRLGDDLKCGRDRDTILRSLRAVASFTQKHFATEESLMETRPGFPLEAAHRQAHRKLMEDLTSLTVDVDVKSMMLTVRFLRVWLLGHIDAMDKPMGVWLREHGGK